MNNDLMKAILSMDSYNRGYNPGIKFGSLLVNSDDTSGVQIGNATIYKNKGDSTAQVDGFYAIAYQMPNDATWSGHTIVSYRGTDNASLFSNDKSGGSDSVNGYGVANGSVDGTQADLAFQFYDVIDKSLNNGNLIDPRMANITLTGHSLGGGLA